MDWSNPISAVLPDLGGAVLVALAGISEPISAREVQRRARRGSKSGVQLVLNRLEEHGLVRAVEAPPARLYSLNRDHVAAPAVLMLLDLRGTLFDRIRTDIQEWSIQPVTSAVFGSAARGDGGIDSDLDVLLVRPDGVEQDHPTWSASVDELSQSIRRWSGNPATILQITKEQVASLIERDAPVAESLRADAIDLGPVPIRNLLALGRSR